jgi:cytochrome P450
VAIDDLELGNYHVPKGYGIFYGNYIAHRDPQVFPNADQFDPQRWDGANAGDQDKIFGFGSGPHRCVGENLMWDVMKFVGHKFVQTFTWDHMDNVMERNIKCLPVLRPRHLSPIILRKL